VLSADKTVKLADNSTINIITKPGPNAIQQADGSWLLPDGTVVLPSGVSVQPNTGSVSNSDGTITFPDGSVLSADGITSHSLMVLPRTLSPAWNQRHSRLMVVGCWLTVLLCIHLACPSSPTPDH